MYLLGFEKDHDLFKKEDHDLFLSRDILDILDLRRQLESTVSRDIDVLRRSRLKRSKAESQGFRSVPFSSQLDITSSRYGRFVVGLSN